MIAQKLGRKNDPSFANHYANDPRHENWSNSLRRQARGTAQNRMDPTTEDSDVPDDMPNHRKLSSFAPAPPGYHTDVPPAYEEPQRSRDPSARHPYLPEAVTSFMSPDYESRSRRDHPYPPGSRPDVVPNRGYNTLDSGNRRYENHNKAARPDRRYGSRDQIDEQPRRYRSHDELEGRARPLGSRENLGERPSPPRSPSSYGRAPAPRNSSFRKALFDRDRPLRDSDASSSRSSSSGEHREPKRYPPVQYDEEPGQRRRYRPPRLEVPSRVPQHDKNPRMSPSPVSPAPSYHSTDQRVRPYGYDDDFLPASTGQRSRMPVYEPSQQRRGNPRTVPVDWGHERPNDSEERDDNVQMSSYQSFV